MPLTLDFAKNTLKQAMKAADEAEVYINIRKQLKIDVLNQKIESMDNITDGGLSLRLIKKNRLGFAYTADVNEAAIEDAIDHAVNNMNNSPQDDHIHLPEPKKQTVSIPLIDPDITETKLEDKVKLTIAMEKAAYDNDSRIKKSEKFFYQDSLSTTILLNSKGLEVFYEKTDCGAYADVIAEADGKMETGSWLMFSTKYKALDPSYIGSEAARRAISMLGAMQEKSGKAPVILSPWAAAVLISSLVPALSAEYAQKGKSIFCSAIGRPVGSSKLTIIDSGVLENGIASVPYDDEGVPTRETTLIKDGILRSFLHNCYTARKANIPSTGNSFRGSFMSLPEISSSNLYVKPGTKPQKEVLDGISKGFLVTNIMGAHTINPISGDFSIGFSGFLIENGRQSRPVRGMTIAGNILDLFHHIEDIASDIMFFPHSGNIGSPSILIGNLSVSGI